MERAKEMIIEELRKQVLSMSGFKKPAAAVSHTSFLGPIAQHFPGGVFPIGTVHEFISTDNEAAAATNGFIAGLLYFLKVQQGACLWISNRRTIFPPALKAFGIAPERFIFVDLDKEKDVLWCVEQALKCTALACVIGELKELSFSDSRRLQLAVEHSRTTCFIHRYRPRTENTTACLTRWKIRSLPSGVEEGMPGVGYPRWQVELAKIRNGQPGQWQVEWAAHQFRFIQKNIKTIQRNRDYRRRLVNHG